MMSTLSTENRRAQAGFTLVELAIVLVIVGLLIGGILKGQELIGATRVNSTVSQAKAIEAATYTFKDTYGQLPGDLPLAATRLPNCTVAAGCAAGTAFEAGGATPSTGNGNVSGSIFDAMAIGGATTTEGTAFSNQLYAGNLISGLVTGGAAALAVGQTVLGAPLDPAANWRIGFQTADLAGMGGTTDNNSHYLALVAGVAGAAVTVTSATGTIPAGGGILPKQANALDSKMDDGNPTLGSMRSLGENTAAGTSCSSQDAAAAAAVYNTALTVRVCGIALKVIQ